MANNRVLGENTLKGLLRGGSDGLEMAALLEKRFPDSAILEGYYYSKKQFDQAIDSLVKAPGRLRERYAISGELVALYVENQAPGTGLSYAMDMVYKDPEHPFGYVMALYAALSAENYTLTNQLRSVLKVKFAIEADEAFLRDLGNAEDYLASDEFAQLQGGSRL